MDRVWMLILAFPEATRALGGAIAGGALALAGLGWQLTKGLARAARIGARAGIETPTTLEQAYPGLPTWFIPESAFGFTLVAAVFVCGAVLAYLGGWARKLTR